MTTGCELYRHDRPSFVSERHHVIPKSWFVGVPVDTPLISVCPTCHSNIHFIIDQMVRGYWGEVALGAPPRQVLFAQHAIELALEKGLTPRRTL